MLGINIIYVDMPCRIKGFILINSDTSYTIFINSKLNLEQQREVYIHEKNHIENNDFEYEDINIVEYIRHGLA